MTEQPRSQEAALDVDELREAARRAGLPREVTVADIENLAREYNGFSMSTRDIARKRKSMTEQPTSREAAPVERVRRGALAECECVPGHRCDCTDLRQLLTDILTNAEYPKMEAEGLAADALALRWSEKDDRYVR